MDISIVVCSSISISTNLISKFRLQNMYQSFKCERQPNATFMILKIQIQSRDLNLKFVISHPKKSQNYHRKKLNFTFVASWIDQRALIHHLQSSEHKIMVLHILKMQLSWSSLQLYSSLIFFVFYFQYIWHKTVAKFNRNRLF